MSDLSRPQHTPTPWVAKSELLYGANEEHIGSTSGADTKFATDFENAAFIVRAVNAHEALVKAIERCLRMEVGRAQVFGNGSMAGSPDDLIAQLRAALALAKGDGE